MMWRSSASAKTGVWKREGESNSSPSPDPRYRLMKIIRTFIRARMVTFRQRQKMAVVECSGCGLHVTRQYAQVKSLKVYRCAKCSRAALKGRPRAPGVRVAGVTHGGAKTRLYSLWSTMKQRCSNPRSASYQWYGGKGVKVCKAWRLSFAAFREWAISSGYRTGLQIHRRRSTRNYSPSNCEWVTPQIQGQQRAGVKLSAVKVLQIRAMGARGASVDVRAGIFRVHKDTIRDIDKRKTWKS